VFDSEVVDKYIAGAVEKIKLEVGGELADKLSGTIDSTISSLAGAVAKVVTSKLEQSSLEMAAYVKQRIEEARLPRTIKIQPKGGEAVKLENEIYHPAFDKIVKLAARRQNIFLPGPAGCGKSHLAAQIARALGLPFGMISLAGGVTESKLVGRNVPNIHTGQDCYQITQFVKCFENGGVFLADECDAADPNVLLIINSALANGLLSVERNGGEVIQRHADFIFIAAANTFGRGADRQYVGRTELDGAFLDRFVIGQVPMDYDTALEEHVCPNKKLREKLWGYRAAIRKHRFERIMSTRTMISAYDMLTNGGFTMTDIDDAIFAGWPEDEAKKAKAGV
jgi:MoxR-like ATPase